MGVIIIILGVIAVVAISAILQGVAISFLWGWFIVPFGIRPIGIAWSIGLALVFHALFGYRRAKNDDEDNYSPIIFAVVAPLLALLMGFIVKQFM